jgi:hypothetical protein
LKRLIVFPLLWLTFSYLMSQMVLKGTIGKSPVEFEIEIYSDDEVVGYYSYTNYDTPIHLAGKREHNQVILEEKDAKGAIQAKMTFHNLSREADTIRGEWRSVMENKTYPILLVKRFELKYEKGTEWSGKQIAGYESTPLHYFVLELVKRKEEYEAKVFRVIVKEKKTDRVLQFFQMDYCMVRFPGNIFTDDYNFDGYKDVSVVVGSGAGPNTWSHYYFYDEMTGRYELFEPFSEMTSLDFDQHEKTIHEFNKSGMSSHSATYRFRMDGTLEIVEESCVEFNEDSGSWEEVNCGQ